MSKSSNRVCPASHASFLASRLRRLIQDPVKILGKMISPGQTVVDLGCGPGFFTLDMARIVGDNGCVIAVDLQQEMLDILARRALDAGVASRIRSHQCGPDGIGLDTNADFVLAFYMIHEVPDAEAFLREVYDLLNPNGHLLLVEPKFHVSRDAWERTLKTAAGVGFCAMSSPRIALSRSVLLGRC